MGELGVVGRLGGAHLDSAAVRDIAGRYGALADDLVETTRRELIGLAFGGATAGHAHGARGEALRGAVEALGEHLRTWARSAEEIAVELGASSVEYRNADVRAGARVG